MMRLEIRPTDTRNGGKGSPVYVAFDMLAANEYFAARYPGMIVDFAIDPHHTDCADCAVFARHSMLLFVIEPAGFSLPTGGGR